MCALFELFSTIDFVYEVGINEKMAGGGGWGGAKKVVFFILRDARQC